jgi:polar amino acid transport system substrate-binding protein
MNNAMIKALALAGLLVLGATNLWAKTIVFATDPTWPPMEFRTPSGEMVGFSLDYMRAVAKEAGFQARFQAVGWDDIFSGLAAGKYQAVCSSVSITEDRQYSMDFSEPYFKVSQAMVVQTKNPARSVEAMSGRTLGVLSASTGLVAVKMSLGLKDKTYDQIDQAFADLAKGLIDGVVCDDPVAAQFVLRTPQYQGRFKIAVTMKNVDDEDYGVAVAKGDKEDLDLINQGIQAVKAKGIDKELTKKWLGQ